MKLKLKYDEVFLLTGNTTSLIYHYFEERFSINFLSQAYEVNAEV